MKLQYNITLLFSLLIQLLLTINAGDSVGNLCSEPISQNSTVSSNINSLLSQLVSKASSSRYAATSSGKGSDKLYGLAQCRSDVSGADCSDCLKDAAKKILQQCPNKANARIWYDYCFLRYQKDNFIGKLDNSYALFLINVENVTDVSPEVFNKTLGNLMDGIKSEAVGSKNQRIGKDQTKLSPFNTLYGLVQCTRDLADLDCAQCLAIAVGNFPNFCNYRKGCRGFYSNCYVRYELYPFFFPLDSTGSSSSSFATQRVVVRA
ncbi:cysteine-rich repeat secretory protein 55-like [Mercurialis annua]|uniref:cysteine-rich repeat secretory protein 55-like n=1 Tax=Mercurialis annua TaxID=3986 RepID=UPI00215E1ED0|nr:cysteine-rich repeat secretory protein 55-like [Mercurialis annua]